MAWDCSESTGIAWCRNCEWEGDEDTLVPADEHERRVEFGRRAVQSYVVAADPEDPQANVVDVIANVLHYAKSNGIHTTTVLRMAEANYTDELIERGEISETEEAA